MLILAPTNRLLNMIASSISSSNTISPIKTHSFDQQSAMSKQPTNLIIPPSSPVLSTSSVCSNKLSAPSSSFSVASLLKKPIMME
jgi:hypothetical protein